jgi:hypothetical protein
MSTDASGGEHAVPESGRDDGTGDEAAQGDDEQAQRREHLKALEDEAIEAEHIDNFLADSPGNDEY